MPQSHIVSIHDIRANVAVAMRGFFFLVLLPGGFVILLLMPVVRDLPDVDLSPLRSSELWLLVALTAGGLFTAVRGTERMTAPYLWTLVIADAGLILAGTTFLVRTATNVDFAEPVPSLVGDIATLVIPVALLATWVLVLPARASLRLLSTRIPPDGTPLPQVLAPPRSQEDAAAVDRRWNPAAVTHRVAAVLAGIVAAVFVLSLLASQHVVQMILSLGLEFTAIAVVTLCWRRGRKLAARSAYAELENDSRPRILYLRSFLDDQYMLDTEWDFLLRSPFRRDGHRLREGWAGLLLTSGGRLEERLAKTVAPLGPLIAVGAPSEPVPELGAARTYLPTDTWQSTVTELVDAAQLILLVAGPTRSVQWELETIVDRNAWPRLVFVMPPSGSEDTAARWANICAALQNTPWRNGLDSLDPHQVVAMRLLDAGALCVVTSDRRRLVDFAVAMRIMLHQLRSVVPA